MYSIDFKDSACKQLFPLLASPVYYQSKLQASAAIEIKIRKSKTWVVLGDPI